MSDQSVGLGPDEVRVRVPTRSARRKWAIVVDRDIAEGRIANATARVAAATAPAVPGLPGPGAADGEGSSHVRLPWAGCSVLAADAGTPRVARLEAATREDVFVAETPTVAREARRHGDYLVRLSAPSAEVTYAAVSVVGPREQVDRSAGGAGSLP